MGTPMADSSLFFVSVLGNDLSSFEHSLETDPTVSEAILFSTSADQRVYRIRLASDTIPFLPTAHDLGIRPLDVKSGTDGCGSFYVPRTTVVRCGLGCGHR